MEISPNQNSAIVSSALRSSVSTPPTVNNNQEQSSDAQTSLRSTDEPEISEEGRRLAAAVNNNTNTDANSPAITNNEDAQKALDQFRDHIKSKPQQAITSHNPNPQVVASVI